MTVMQTRLLFCFTSGECGIRTTYYKNNRIFINIKTINVLEVQGPRSIHILEVQGPRFFIYL